jgi:hypothetical protein
MKLGDLTELAARNLREAVLRNSLTTLGISVGVASLVALLSLGVGLQQLVDRSLARAGLFDMVSVRSRQSAPFGQPGGGRRSPRDAADVTPPRPLDEAARREIAALPNVLEVNPEIRFTAEARREPISQLVMVSGLAESSQSSGTLDGMNGHFFSGPDAEEAILQGDLAKRLVDTGQAPGSLLGQEITLRFAQRQALPPPSQQAPTDAPNQAVGPDEEAMGFSIVPSEKKFGHRASRLQQCGNIFAAGRGRKTSSRAARRLARCGAVQRRRGPAVRGAEHTRQQSNGGCSD